MDTASFWDFLRSQTLSGSCLVLSSDWCSRCIDQCALINPDQYTLQDPRLTPSSQTHPGQHRAISSPSSQTEGEVGTNEMTGRKRASSPPRSLKLVKTPSMASPASPNPVIEPSSPQTLISSAKSPESLAGESVVASNQVLVDIFYDLAITRRLEGEEFSSQAYERALRALRSAPGPVLNRSDALKVPGVTARMATLVQDIRDGKVTRNLTKPGREKTETLQLFASVYGVGTYNARKLYDRGFRTLAEIKQHVDINGRVSIEHHGDFQERMSRDEVAQHFQLVKKLAATIDSDLQAECMGSYRRGQPDCGDIDIILTKVNSGLRELKQYRKELITLMFDQGFAVHTFTKGSDRWLGATQVVAKWRRMDILLVPWKELGASFIYYTGNDVFNRRLRLKAKRKGLLLNHAGLFENLANGEQKLLEGHDERRIFELLNEPWRDAKERNVQ